MSTILLIIQFIICIVLILLILIQRSEGGALGIGGGGGGFMSDRRAASSVTRLTSLLGMGFIINCLILSIVFNREARNQSVFEDKNDVQALTIERESGETINPLVIEPPLETGTASQTPESEQDAP